jgi:hypothetical protein
MIEENKIVAFFHPGLKEIFTGTVLSTDKVKEKNVYKISYQNGSAKMTAVVEASNVVKMGS